jgi:hypothetical protein
MAGHVRILGALHLIFGSLGVLVGVIALMFFGGLAGLVGVAGHTHHALLAVPILGGIGGIIFFLVLLLSLPSILAGAGLLHFRPWARILTIILSAFDLLHVPLGTLLGIYGFWVLLSREGEQLFAPPAAVGSLRV